MSTTNTSKKSNQVKTTLPEPYYTMLASVCSKEVKKEAEVVREALIKYLRFYSSNEVIRS